MELTSPRMTISRRSASYQPSWWDYRFLQALLRDLTLEANPPISYELVVKVRQQTYDLMGPLHQLELIEAVERLGLDYLFEEDINRILSALSRNDYVEVIRCGLRATSICFRLLRRFGLQAPEGIFNAFVDEKKNFMANLSEDIFGMLCLYQASFVAFNGEQMMETARSFASTCLREKSSCSLDHRVLISHALNHPLHRRMPWMEARTFIDAYELQDGMSPELLLLAKQHFNAVQSIHQKELRKLLSWWESFDLRRSISFSRNRLAECFLFVVGIVHQPEFGICRKELTKVGMLIATIDDVYDLYGTLEELELFTQAVNRWDVNGMKELPDYMKTCFSALVNTTNEVEKHLSSTNSSMAMPFIRKVWADLCESFLVESKWYKQGYKPTLKEYLSIASISISGQTILLHVYVLMKCKITEEILQHLQDFPNIVRLPSLIFRLCNDLATYSAEQERGDAPTSIQCCMNETGVSEEEACRQISMLVSEAWKELNRECSSDLPFPRRFVNATVNLARTASFFYQQGDGFSAPNHEIKASIKSLLLNKINL